MTIFPCIEVRDTVSKGKSLFALEEIPKDRVILVYYGAIVGIRQRSIYTLPISDDLAVDPIPVDGLGQYLCHSCEPNAGIRSRNLIVAMRDIKPDEEICIDYAMVVRKYPGDRRKEHVECHCGAENCRGRVGSWEELPGQIRSRYGNYVSDYLVQPG